MLFQIEKNVQPPSHMGRGREPKYPFAQMEIGDSFLVPILGGEKKLHPVRRAASMAGFRGSKRFSCRTVDDGIRVWRTA